MRTFGAFWTFPPVVPEHSGCKVLQTKDELSHNSPASLGTQTGILNTASILRRNPSSGPPRNVVAHSDEGLTALASPTISSPCPYGCDQLCSPHLLMPNLKHAAQRVGTSAQSARNRPDH